MMPTPVLCEDGEECLLAPQTLSASSTILLSPRWQQILMFTHGTFVALVALSWDTTSSPCVQVDLSLCPCCRVTSKKRLQDHELGGVVWGLG